MSSAAWLAMSRIKSRPPPYSRVRTTPPMGLSTANTTVPTGFSSVPPSGPAMPVMATPTSAPVARSDAVRHRLGHRFADGAVRGDELGRHAEQARLRLVAVADDTAVDVGGAARESPSGASSRRPPVHDSAAARCQPRSRAAGQRPARSLLRRRCRRRRQARGCVRSRLRERAPSRLRFGRRVHGEVQVDRAARGEDRRLRSAVAPAPTRRRTGARLPRCATRCGRRHARSACRGACRRFARRAARARRPSSIGISSRGGPGSSTTT